LKSSPSSFSESLVSRNILQPKAWAEFFILLRGKGDAGAFVDGFLNLQAAGVIIAFHNVWSGIPAAPDVVGWCLLIKSLIRFCAPKVALRMMARVSVERAWSFRWRAPASWSLPAFLAMGSTPASMRRSAAVLV
jgi:hypothetical protein